MIRISVYYPNRPGARFDHRYYAEQHIPLAVRLLGDALRSVTVEQGLDPGPPWPAPTHVAVAHFTCDSLEAYARASAPHAAVLQADVANYTDIAPVIQVGRVQEASVPGSTGDR